MPVNSGPRKRNSKEAWLQEDPKDDLDDTATSPLKQTEGAISSTQEEVVEHEKGARKKLDMEAGMGEDSFLDKVPPLPPQYVTPNERKKQKRNVSAASRDGETAAAQVAVVNTTPSDGHGVGSLINKEAASGAEGRREQ
jgi:hypothetical protein